MTKAEKERMDRLERSLAMARAMRWPEYPMPEPMSAAEIEANKGPGGMKWGSPQKVARGWFTSSYQNGSVSYGCSDGIHHSREGDTTSTQQAGCMFHSEADAWRAVRIELTEEYAARLARIDAKIAALG